MFKPENECALVLADISEFTLAMEVREAEMSMRVETWVRRCVQGWLNDLGGCLLQQAGDGLWLAFGQAEQALEAVQRLASDWQNVTRSQPGAPAKSLRLGLHWGRVSPGGYGYVAHSMNQLARLTQQALPDQVWASQDFWQRLPASVQPPHETLGWMYFKHLSQPLQVLRLWPEAVAVPHSAMSPACPRLLLLGQSGESGQAWTTLWLKRLSGLSEVNVAAWAGSAESVWPDMGACLRAAHADYMLVQTRDDGMALWAGPLGHLFRHWTGTDMTSTIDTSRAQSPALRIQEAMAEHGLAQGRSQGQAQLSVGALAWSSLQMMHRGHGADFSRVKDHLSAWRQRAPRSAAPLLCQTLWGVLGHTRGVLRDHEALALTCAQEALRLEPEHAHAHAMQGFALAHLRGDPESGMRALEQAQAIDPALPWIDAYRSTLWCMLDRPAEALAAARRSLSLDATDPWRAYRLCLAGHAALWHGQPGVALTWLHESWQAHRHHSPTVRALVMAHQMLGQGSLAAFFLTELLRLEPGLTARSYLGKTRAGHGRRAELAHWLMAAGLPMK